MNQFPGADRVEVSYHTPDPTSAICWTVCACVLLACATFLVYRLLRSEER